MNIPYICAIIMIDMMKKIVTFLVSFLLGIVIGGLAVLGVIFILEGQDGMSEFIGKLADIKVVELIIPILGAFIAMFVAIVLHIILHEGGHLLMGFATGYRFISFRIASVAFIRKERKIRIRRFKLAGTGGQCLMSPPDMTPERVPFFWYNAGGVLMNLVFALLPLFLLLTCDMPMWLEMLCMMMTIVGLFLALVNGIPMRPGGMQNDAMNILTLYRNPQKRKDFIRQLQIAAEVTAGKRLIEIPAEWFDADKVDDYKDLLRLASRMNYQARLIDEGRFMDAQLSVEDLVEHFSELPMLAQQELAGEYVFTELLTKGRKEVIEKYWTKQLEQYVKSSARYSSGKQRILFAYALYMEKNNDEAMRIYNDTLAQKSDYLIEGEVRGDLALMEEILRNHHEATHATEV